MVLSLMFRALGIAFLLLGCTQVERNNPYDPDGINYSPGLVQEFSSSVEPPPSSSSSATLSSSSIAASSSSVELSSSSALPSSSSIETDNPSSSSDDVPSSSSVEPCTANNNTSTHYCSEGTMKEYGLLTDNRNNPPQTYKTVVIGTQTWMAENLNYAVSESKCGNGNSYSDNNTEACNTYGRLYDWTTAMNGATSSIDVPSGVRGVCPAGWHLPSYAEWEELIASVGYNNNGKKLKATSGWKWNSDNDANGNGTDDYGFSALPGGSGFVNVFHHDLGYGYWWSSSIWDIDDLSAYIWYMFYNSEFSGLGPQYKGYLLSVRCLQDY